MSRTNDQKPRLGDEQLQRYHDGELSASERAEVEARLDGDARARLEALDELGGLLRQHSAREADEAVVSSALAATIAAIERGAPIAPANVAAPSQPRRMRVSMYATFLAGAAALAFVFWPGREVVSGVAQVEQLEVAGSVATVFNIESGDDPGKTATVIWAALDDEDEPEAVPVPVQDDEESEAL